METWFCLQMCVCVCVFECFLWVYKQMVLVTVKAGSANGWADLFPCVPPLPTSPWANHVCLHGHDRWCHHNMVSSRVWPIFFFVCSFSFCLFFFFSFLFFFTTVIHQLHKNKRIINVRWFILEICCQKCCFCRYLHKHQSDKCWEVEEKKSLFIAWPCSLKVF